MSNEIEEKKTIILFSVIEKTLKNTEKWDGAEEIYLDRKVYSNHGVDSIQTINSIQYHNILNFLIYSFSSQQQPCSGGSRANQLTLLGTV